MTIKAIETCYDGYRFRSRTEARWAVFFNALGIQYRYEVEGFEYKGVRYLPDFFIPSWDLFVEVKPSRALLTDSDKLKINTFVAQSGRSLVVLHDTPGEGHVSVTVSNGGIRHQVFDFLSQCPLCKALYVGRYVNAPNPALRHVQLPAYTNLTVRPHLDKPVRRAERKGTNSMNFATKCVVCKRKTRLRMDDVLNAVVAARSARFEFGETPQPTKVTQ